MHQQLARIWNKALIHSLARQLAFGSLVEDCEFGIDITTGHLNFSNGLEYKIQVIGTESEESNSWLWAWANESIDNPDILSVARKLQALGEEKQVPELTTPQLPLDGENNGLVFITVAQHIAKAPTYYSCDTGAGRAFFLVYPCSDTSRYARPKPHMLNEAFAQVMPSVPFNHQLALVTAAKASGIAVTSEDRLSIAGVDYEFDQYGSVTSFTQHQAPSEAPTGPVGQTVPAAETEPKKPALAGASPTSELDIPEPPKPEPARSTSRRHRRRRR